MLVQSINKNASPLAKDAMTFGLPIRGLPFVRNDTELIKFFCVCLRPYNQPYNSPLQICIAGRMHFSNQKLKRHVLFKLEEKCTRAHVQENKQKYIATVCLNVAGRDSRVRVLVKVAGKH